jgi:hypothetical protein
MPRDLLFAVNYLYNDFYIRANEVAESAGSDSPPVDDLMAKYSNLTSRLLSYAKQNMNTEVSAERFLSVVGNRDPK